MFIVCQFVHLFAGELELDFDGRSSLLTSAIHEIITKFEEISIAINLRHQYLLASPMLISFHTINF
jgi:hypothetical protein